jgi:hypothetical protein
MTKERAYKHINFYFELHGYNRIKCWFGAIRKDAELWIKKYSIVEST